MREQRIRVGMTASFFHLFLLLGGWSTKQLDHPISKDVADGLKQNMNSEEVS